MNRREALTLLGTLFSGTIFGANRMLAGVANALDDPPPPLSPDDLALLNEVGETILPATTGSPGAKAANVAAFMQEIVRDFYDDKERATFLAGLAQLQSASRAKFSGRAFLDLAPDERHALLLTFEKPNSTPDWYRMTKQLAVWGYFSSEIGATQAMQHVAVPGRYDSCVAITPGTKAWSD